LVGPTFINMFPPQLKFQNKLKIKASLIEYETNDVG